MLIMKYFKQTKETRRMLSFFLSLALMISLIPASNKVAKAADARVNVTGKVANAAYANDLAAVSEGKVTFTVKANEGYKFENDSAVTVTPSKNSDNSGSVVVSAAAVTSGAVADATKAVATKALSSDGKTITVTVTNIQESVTLTLGGVGAVEDNKTPSETSTTTPSETSTPTPEYTLTFTKNLTKAEVSYKVNAKAATPSAIKADETLTITVSPVGNGTAFKTAPTVTTTTATVSEGTKSGESYVFEVSKFTGNTTITITATAEAAEMVSEVAENNVVVAEAAIDPAELKDIQDKAVEALNLTDAEKASISGENSENYIALELGVVDVKEEDKTAADTAVTDKKADIVSQIKADTNVSGANITATDVKVGKYLNITVTAKLKKRADGSAVEGRKATVNDTVKNLTITIEVDSLGIERLNDATKVRVYYVVRIHGTEITVIPCVYNKADDSISFDSSKFSTYVLCYADVPEKAGSTVDNDKGLANYPVKADPAPTTSPAPTASAAPSASPSASATPTTSAAPTTEPGTGDGNTGNDNTTGGNTGNTGGNGTVNNPGGNNNTDDGDKTTTTKKKTISKLKVTAKKNAKQIKVTTIKKAKVVVTTNRKVIKSGKKSVKKITIKAANNKKGNVTVKLSKKLKKGDKITVKVSKSGYKTKTKTVKVK